jgi:hypothetical protein
MVVPGGLVRTSWRASRLAERGWLRDGRFWGAQFTFRR